MKNENNLGELLFDSVPYYKKIISIWASIFIIGVIVLLYGSYSGVVRIFAVGMLIIIFGFCIILGITVAGNLYRFKLFEYGIIIMHTEILKGQTR